MKPTLLLLAAGRGSRFGGPKQLTPVGPSGEPLLAYTIHDAAKAGFGRAVLVCPPTLGASMSETFRRITGAGIEIVAVEQTTPPGRSKPWGTGHAVLEAATLLGNTPFGVANGDDWYGLDALTSLADALRQEGRTTHVLITYALGRTLAFTEGVSRGECDIQDGLLQGVREIFDVRRGDAECQGRLGDGQPVKLSPDAPVSMNLWGFVPPFLHVLEGRWDLFRADAERVTSGAEPEFLLPHAVTDLIDAGMAAVEALPTDEHPFGLTRPEDLDAVRTEIARLVAEGTYPADLRGSHR